MSNSMNETSCKPIRKSIKQMDLDAELPNILSSKLVKYCLSQKQDAQLPSKITDTKKLKHVGYDTIKNQSRKQPTGPKICCQQALACA
jgi:hypothetical protein